MMTMRCKCSEHPKMSDVQTRWSQDATLKFMWWLEQIEVYETYKVLRSFSEPGSDANLSTECFLSKSLSNALNRNTAYAFAHVIRDQPWRRRHHIKDGIMFSIGISMGKLYSPKNCSIECGKCIINADIQRQFNELSTNFKNHQRWNVARCWLADWLTDSCSCTSYRLSR